MVCRRIDALLAQKRVSPAARATEAPHAPAWNAAADVSGAALFVRAR